MEIEEMLKIIHVNLQKTAEGFTPLNKTRGEAAFRSGMVLICEMFIETGKSCRIDSKVQGSAKKPYSVVLRFNGEGHITDKYCTCPAYLKSSSGGKSGMCKHCAAVVYYMLADINSCKINETTSKKADAIDELELFMNEIPNNKKFKNTRQIKTDIFGARMIEKYEKEAMSSSMLPIFPSNLSLVPLMSIDQGNQCSLEFTIGNGRQYIVRDIYAMGRAIHNHSIIDFGKGLSVFFSPSCFDNESQLLIDFIAKLTETDREYFWSLMGGTAVSGSDLRKLFLPSSKLDEFFEIMKGRTIGYHGHKEGLKSITFRDEQIPLMFTAEQKDDGVILRHNLGSYRYIDDLINGGIYVIKSDDENNASMYKCTGKTADSIGPLLEAFKRNTNQEQLQFSEDALAKLRKYVLPRLKAVGKLESDLKDSRGTKNTIKLESKIYLDRPRGRSDIITAELKYIYGGHIIDAFAKETMIAAARIPRDSMSELRILFILKEQGFYSDGNGQMILSGDDRIFTFLSEGVQKAEKYAEVFISDALKKINIRRPKSPSVKIKLSGGMIEMIMNSEFPPDQMPEMLSAYREKKKFFKLKDGTFIKLDDDNMGIISDIEKNLDIEDDKLSERELKFPAYRSLYIKNLLEKHPENAASINKSYRELVAAIGNIENTDLDIPIKGLREYQIKGVKWLKGLADYSLGGILADEMGLGKTIQIISFLSLPQQGRKKPSIVIAPTSLVYNWKSEFAKFSPETIVTVVSGSVSQRHELIKNFGDGIIITSYDALKRDIDQYEQKKFKYVIIDEAQYIKNQTTQAAVAVKGINGEVKFALTGTPIENSLSDLWSIYDFVMPGYLYNYAKFRRKYEIPIMRDDDNQASEALLDQVKPFILRRTKKEVLKELPDKIESKVYVEMEEEQRLVYDANLAKAKEELKQEIDKYGFDRSRIKILSLITRLRHLCCHPALFLEGYAGGSSKLELCKELLHDSMEEGHKVLIFSQFVSMLEIIAGELNKDGTEYYLLKGDTPSEERIRMVNEFNTNQVPVFLISLRAGGTGLNLTSADVVIHYDPWWNISVQNQATDRAHRIGQEKNVRVFKLLVKDSIEDKIDELQHQKEKISKAVITANETFISNMNRDDLLELFSD